jgi:hypothetical protein
MMTSVIGSVRASAPIPARTRTRMISSVAYADEEMLSEANTARPVTVFTRSWGSSHVASGRPISDRFSRSNTRLMPRCGWPRPSRGIRWPGSGRRKSRWRRMRTYRSPGRCPPRPLRRTDRYPSPSPIAGFLRSLNRAHHCTSILWRRRSSWAQWRSGERARRAQRLGGGSSPSVRKR